MARFRTAGHLASWAGVCPGHHESAGKHKSGRRRHGNRWLNAALGTAAMASSRTRERTYLGARYMRLMPRLGKKKALVALEHSLMTAVWHILTTDAPFNDSAATTTPDTTPNAPCDAPPARPTHSDSPSASNPSKPEAPT